MDALGQRCISDRQFIESNRRRAASLEAEAKRLRDEAGEAERLLELARLQR